MRFDFLNWEFFELSDSFKKEIWSRLDSWEGLEMVKIPCKGSFIIGTIQSREIFSPAPPALLHWWPFFSERSNEGAINWSS